MSLDVSIVSNPVDVAVNSQAFDVSINPTPIQVSIGNVGPQGPQGAPGIGVPVGGTTGQSLIKASNADYDTEWGNPGGGGSLLQQSLTLGETLSAYRVVYANLDGKAYAASSDDLGTSQSVRGITTQAGDADTAVNVVLEGEITNTGWNWSGDQNLYLGTDGAITATPPAFGFNLRVGYATGAQSMAVNIGLITIIGD